MSEKLTLSDSWAGGSSSEERRNSKNRSPEELAELAEKRLNVQEGKTRMAQIRARRMRALVHPSRLVYSSGELAVLLGVAPRTVSKWLDNGMFTGFYRLPGSLDRRVSRAGVIEFIRRHNLPQIKLFVQETVPSVGVPKGWAETHGFEWYGVFELGARLATAVSDDGFLPGLVVGAQELSGGLKEMRALLGQLVEHVGEVPIAVLLPDDCQEFETGPVRPDLLQVFRQDSDPALVAEWKGRVLAPFLDANAHTGPGRVQHAPARFRVKGDNLLKGAD